ncbi:twin-arginine translocation signal domain-containing protein, partial [Dehalococcoides mccartyi]
MKEFHSTLSRRDFMKSLGVVGAGLGTMSAAAPVFHDLDEVTSSTLGINKNPWWVKERDFKNPTVPIDWSKVTRQPGVFQGLPRPTVAD